jgi:beta-glucosidase
MLPFARRWALETDSIADPHVNGLPRGGHIVKKYSYRNDGVIYVRYFAPGLGSHQERRAFPRADTFFRMPGSVLRQARKQDARSPGSFSCVVGILLIALLVVAARPVQASAQAAVSATDSIALYKQPDVPIERRVEDLLSRMTMKEKVRQLDLYSGATSLMDEHTDGTHAAATAHFQPDKGQRLWGNLGVGAIHDLNPTPQQANTIQKWVIEHNRLGIPVLFIEEGLHGFDAGTVFPAPINLSATWNPTVVEKVGAAIAAEARSTGVGMILAPVLDLAREPRWGRVEEDYGEDPYLTGQLGLAYVRGAQGASLSSDRSVVSEPKHFAGHGSPEGGTNTSPVHLGERELRSIMLKSFEPAIRDGNAMGIMAAYHEIDGVPITADPFLLKKILRQEWGFQGFVLSDLGAVQRLYGVHHVAATPKQAVCLAIKSGVDMQFYDFEHEVFQNALIDCAGEGSLPISDLDRAVKSVLRVKFALGLFDHPMTNPNLKATTYRSQEHLELSLEAARQSMTLLKNDGHLLPLSKSVKRIAVIGPNAGVARYGDYENELNGARISMLEGIRALVPGTTVDFDEGRDIPAAIAKTKEADVVILGLGEWQGISGEGFDRTNLSLPGNQEQLLEAVVATGRPVVLVLENGRPLTIGWAKEHVPAILEAWYPGEFGGRAIAESLFGDNNPAGRLTITFPRSVGQLPDFYNSDPSRNHKYVDDDGAPLFPFGFGLSYTSFRYDHLAVHIPAPGSDGEILVAAEVTNIGNCKGDEVAQLYVRQEVGSVETPAISLKGFSRIALNPQETKTVAFRIPQSQLAVWDAEGKWTVESGNYTLWVGGSSQASLSTKFVINPQ